MSLAFSFPGIYVQELPLSSHAITPAPTSIAAFVGYSHPYRTVAFDVAVQIFSFTDYEAAFGGLFTSGLVDPSLPRAVLNFFLNGGSSAWVVGLQAEALDVRGNSLSAVFGLPATSGTIQYVASIPTLGGAIALTALELCDLVPMTVTVANLRASTSPPLLDTFDLVITYGTRNEIYRGLSLNPANPAKAPDIVINAASTLVQVTPGGFGTGFQQSQNNTSFTFAISDITLLTNLSTTFNPSDFTAAFATNSSLDKVEIFNLLLIPGVSDNLVVSTALAFAELKRAFAILDPPFNAVADTIIDPKGITIDQYITEFPKSQNGALYFPYLLSTDAVTTRTIAAAPSGFVAGIYARTDANRGVWKAPAGIETTVLNTAGPVTTGLMNDPQQGVLNIDAINVLRTFNAIGTVVFGARTLVGANANTAFPQSKYVPVRRMTLFIEQSLVANLKWVVFEPNAEPLWIAIRTSIEAFLLSLFNQGALQGDTPSQAFQVKVDATTTTPTDQANGIVNVVVAFAPLKPAEFVVIKISQLAGQTAGT